MGSFGYQDIKFYSVEDLEMYDSNGNRFYLNCSSLDEAEKMVEKLKAEGKDAVIGPKAPKRLEDGTLIKNGDENAVGIYIVKSIEEKEKIKDGQELGE